MPPELAAAVRDPTVVLPRGRGGRGRPSHWHWLAPPLLGALALAVWFVPDYVPEFPARVAQVKRTLNALVRPPSPQATPAPSPGPDVPPAPISAPTLRDTGFVPKLPRPREAGTDAGPP
jgi:hypothetical protein